MAAKTQKRLPLIPPGEVLQDILNEACLTANALALALRVPSNRIGAILKGQRGITADTALRLARYFGASAAMWISLQAKYDLAAAEDAMGRRIEREAPREPRPDSSRAGSLSTLAIIRETAHFEEVLTDGGDPIHGQRKDAQCGHRS